MSEMIRVEHLSYVYAPGMPDEHVALDDISFTVQEGEFLGVIGSTGCGKSTLISHFNGINRPTSGKIYINGQDLWSDPSQIRSFRFQVGLVFQYPEYQLFEETVAADIAYGPRNMGLPEEEIQRRVEEAAQFCGIAPHMMEKSPFDLSGGQKRRVAIAGVLAMEPKVLVLDEPAAGLDPEGRDMILGQIAKYADRVLVLSGGKIAMHDTTAAVFARAQELLELGLSVPEVTKVFLRLRQMGLDVPVDVYTVPYAVDMLKKLKENGVAKICAKGENSPC